MSLLLCRNEPVKHPFYVEKLGINLYSSQELCYVLYHHPLMTLDGFIDVNLIEFMGQELDLGFLAVKLDKWQKSGGSYDELPIIILQECYYYTPSEINKYKQQLAAYRKMPPAEYQKAVADYYFGLKQYGFAMQCYEKLLEKRKDQGLDDSFLARVWNDIGACYASVFWYEKALWAYDVSYGLSKNPAVLKRIYQLTLLDSSLSLKDRYQSMMTDEWKISCQRELEEMRKEALGTDRVQEVVLLFQKDQVKRMAGAGDLLYRWKQEYRKMI